MDRVRSLVRDVPDFPKKGIVFRDITPVLADGPALQTVVQAFADRYRDLGITHVAGIESRGFILGTPLAYALGVGIVLVRKPGKLPRQTHSAAYALEYGEDTVHIHCDALGAQDRVVIIDDLMATGGTAGAAAQLVQKCGASVVEIGVLIELEALNGRARLPGHRVHSLLTY